MDIELLNMIEKTVNTSDPLWKRVVEGSSLCSVVMGFEWNFGTVLIFGKRSERKKADGTAGSQGTCPWFAFFCNVSQAESIRLAANGAVSSVVLAEMRKADTRGYLQKPEMLRAMTIARNDI